MAEETAQTTGTEETNGQSTDAAKEFQAITSQEDFDKAIQARIARERSKFSDYDDLKAKADKFAEWENAQKTEAQKAQEALEQAQRELAETRLQAARAEVAASKGVPVELLSGGTREELEAAADALIAFRGEPAKGPVIPGQGKQPPEAAQDADDWLRQAARR
ncbi:DUF4355 domain-containing protein [Microbacterium sp. p3-SID131]|uniref:capsid assembly scaffolding protein Gp46 family protein n=1 Tax=Microbacterium sp. p3-SID131 TaxID=2916215 RepID=UPI0021A89449|nr:DUF4355 domain-containing protein [Microbacterium sp. p3-SID131]MCT1363316.1 DUF4355 domain-containing protein [Microbacterium sp. p3-SID131]